MMWTVEVWTKPKRPRPFLKKRKEIRKIRKKRDLSTRPSSIHVAGREKSCKVGSAGEYEDVSIAIAGTQRETRHVDTPTACTLYYRQLV